MRPIALGLAIILIGCAGGQSSEDTACGHCWLYAGLALSYAGIEEGFAQAELLVDQTNDVDRISKALYRNMIKTLEAIDYPDELDLNRCAGAMCAIIIDRGETTNHAQVYDYASDRFFDNCRCWHGCTDPVDGTIVQLFIATEWF